MSADPATRPDDPPRRPARAARGTRPARRPRGRGGLRARPPSRTAGSPSACGRTRRSARRRGSPRPWARRANPRRIRRPGGPARPWLRVRRPWRWPRACARARGCGCRQSRGRTRRARRLRRRDASMHRLRSRRGCRLRPARGSVPGVPASGASWARDGPDAVVNRPLLPPEYHRRGAGTGPAPPAAGLAALGPCGAARGGLSCAAQRRGAFSRRSTGS